MIGIYSCSLLTTADLCTQVHARTYRWCVCEKCFASLHFTDIVVDLVSSVAVGLTFKDFLITFCLVCHVLSTNQSCQMKGLKSKLDRTLVSSNHISHRPSRMQTYITYSWMSITEIFFALLKVSGNRQSFATGFVPFFRNKFPGLFQDFSRTQTDFSRALKFTLTPTLPRSQC